MPRRRLFVLTLVLAALGAGFVWGFAAHKFRLFPFHLLRAMAQKTSAVPHDEIPVGAAPANLDSLIGLAYTGGTLDPNSANRDVFDYDPEKAHPGYNFYASRGRHVAYLLDMDGKTLHQWDFPEAGFLHVEVAPNGDLLAVQLSRQIIKIDRESNRLWSYEDQFHHSIWIDDEGRIYGQVRRPRLVREMHPTVPVRDERIVVLSPDGELLDDFSILDAFLESPFAFLLPSVAHLDFEGDLASSGNAALDV
ncbi:MAG: hypothetical protein AAF657_20575, partial [Acidobacteriota bacterium]